MKKIISKILLMTMCFVYVAMPCSANAATDIKDPKISNEQGQNDIVAIAEDGSFVILNEMDDTIDYVDVIGGMAKAPTVPSPGAKTSLKVSFKSIKNGAGDTSTLTWLAKVVVKIVSKKYAIPGMVSTVLDKISKIAGFTSLVMKGDSNHGIKINLAYSIKQGQGEKRAVWKVTSISKY